MAKELSAKQIELLVQVYANNNKMNLGNSNVTTKLLEEELEQLFGERYLINAKETSKGLDCNLSVKGQEVAEKHITTK